MLRSSSYGFILMSLFSLALAKDFRGAEYRTIEAYTYGRIETSMRSAPHTGVISSLFTFHEIGSSGPANWNEIDIEFLGRYNDQVQFNTITENQTGHEHQVELDYNPAQEFHEYAFEWTPDYVAWFIDGEEVYRQSESHIAELHRPSKIMMNIWPSTNVAWAGPFYDALLPIFAYYDRVSYYAYTPGSGNTGTDNNFALLWRDDFDSWDTGRWQKANHTFDTNNCDFIPENAVIQDGYLILCLTTPEATGYHGPTLGLGHETNSTPEDWQLLPAYPNPFNNNLRIELSGLQTGSIVFEIFDIQGQMQYRSSLHNQGMSNLHLDWDGLTSGGTDLPSGSYIVRASHGSTSQSMKVLMVK